MRIVLDQTWPLAAEKDVHLRVLVGDVTSLIEDEAAVAQALEQLSPGRRAKAEAEKHPRGRALSIGVAQLLDRLLHEVGLRERDMSYAEGEHGKPRFSGSADAAFSLSHSGHLAAAAMLDRPSACRVGLDVQRISRYRPELVRRVFNAEDRAVMAACTGEAERERLFTRLWCRAEAYAKATGQGLQWPCPTPSPQAHFTELDLGAEDYCGCLCWIDP